MKNILVIGAGKIGSVVADLLSQAAAGTGGAYRVVVADRDPALLAAIERSAPASRRLATLQLDVANTAALRSSSEECGS